MALKNSFAAAFVGIAALSAPAFGADAVHSGAVTINMDVLRDLGQPPKPVIHNLGKVPANQAPTVATPQQDYTYVAPATRQMTADEAVAMIPPPMKETQPPAQLTAGPLNEFDSVSILHSPDMEEQKAKDGKLELDDETWDFINKMRAMQKEAPEPKTVEVTPAQPASAYYREQRQGTAAAKAAGTYGQTAGQPSSPDMSIVAEAAAPAAQGPAQDSLAFTPGAAELPQSEKQKVLVIAARHQEQGGKLQVIAYADDRSMSPTRARQLSLRRALVVRNELIAAGVPADMIDVRAQATPSTGSPDRADIVRL